MDMVEDADTSEEREDIIMKYEKGHRAGLPEDMGPEPVGIYSSIDHFGILHQTRPRVLGAQACAGFTWQEEPLRGEQAGPSQPTSLVPAAYLVSFPAMGTWSFHTLSRWGCPGRRLPCGHSGCAQPSPGSGRTSGFLEIPAVELDAPAPNGPGCGGPWFPHYFKQSCWVPVSSECVQLKRHSQMEHISPQITKPTMPSPSQHPQPCNQRSEFQTP
ncbi:PREDICTED: uncharacterized protein LOC108517304 [Rhinopithecus bieti]|uniref:uncharacterized protein LOC108517304 n=1 Tax=Rhinopithecus bieti TaxID=61621 RepID=UPI00083BD7FC|nr:PREDICTED: uncharacterized protein LOC108517304 [Rhinopithecus bieti]XP_017710636.1 PREDICTED: uncharacterized protein LOC108517304 [Rhinopithecus bieti]